DDLDRVEVLRGPQGTLYGKNATGGAISFYTKNPSLTAYDGYLTAGAGNYSAYSVQGAVGGPVIDNEIGWRAAVMYEKRDGWVRSVVPGVEPLNGLDALAGRLTLLAKPNDSLTAQLKLSASRSGGTPYGAHAINTDPSYARTNDPTASYFTGNIGWFDNGAKFAVHKDIRSDNATLKIDWQLSPPPTLYGLDEYHNFDQLKDSRAVFFNATYALAPTVTLRAWLRYTKDKVTISNFYALEGGLASPGATTAATGTDPNIDATTWWTQTVGNPALYPPPPPNTPPTAGRTYFQQGLAVQGYGFVPTVEHDT